MTSESPILANLHAAKRFAGAGTSDTAKQTQFPWACHAKQSQFACRVRGVLVRAFVETQDLASLRLRHARGPVVQKKANRSGVLCGTKPISGGWRAKQSQLAGGQSGYNRCVRKGFCEKMPV